MAPVSAKLKMGLAFVLFAGCVTWVAAGGGPKKGPATKSPDPSVLDAWLKLSPENRMKSLATVTAGEKVFVPVMRGPIVETIFERANLHAVESSVITCEIKSAKKGAAAVAIIKWVIDDGVIVKKGDKLIEFDDVDFRGRLKQQKQQLSQAETELRKTAEDAADMRKQSEIDVKLAEIDLQVALAEIKKYAGKDQAELAILELKAKRQENLLLRAKLVSQAKDRQAAADVDARKQIVDQEKQKFVELEKQGAKYIVHSPRDGMVVYYVPEQARFGGGPQALVAQGEPVREGQKLLLVTDLRKMAAKLQVHEAQIHKVRTGQKAAVRVDAFPNRVESGRVTEVATVATMAEFFNRDIKTYAVTVTLDGENKTMKPGMSSEVRITVADKKDCLIIPRTAVFNQGKDRFCLVSDGKELQTRKLKVGNADERSFEIIEGLKENEPVLTEPLRIAERIAKNAGKPK